MFEVNLCKFWSNYYHIKEQKKRNVGHYEKETDKLNGRHYEKVTEKRSDGHYRICNRNKEQYGMCSRNACKY